MFRTIATSARLLQPRAAAASGTRHGIALFVGASISFACMNTLAKFASQGLHLVEVSWGRYFFSLLFLGFVLPRLPAKRPLASARPTLQIGRSALLLGVTLMFFGAISYMPLVDAVAIGQTTPLIVTALAGPLLKERVGRQRWLAVGIGFVGVLVIIRPGLGTIQWAALIMLAAAMLNALYHLSTRALAGVDRPETTVVYTAIFGTCVLTAALPIVWTDPELWEIGELLVLGGLGFASQYLLAMAYTRAPASTLAPYAYLIIVWLGVLGYLVFGEVPDFWTVLGTLVVVAAGLYLYRHEVRSQLKPAAAPQSAEEIDEVG
jgi:drug/metabolite transporter (DMT)-like permease